MRVQIMKALLAFTVAMWFVTALAIDSASMLPYICNVMCSLMLLAFGISNDWFERIYPHGDT